MKSALLILILIVIVGGNGYGQRIPQNRFEKIDSTLILIDNNNAHVLTITNLNGKNWREWKFKITDTTGGYIMMLEEIKRLQKENAQLQNWLDKCGESEDRKDRLLVECSDTLKQFIAPKSKSKHK